MNDILLPTAACAHCGLSCRVTGSYSPLLELIPGTSDLWQCKDMMACRNRNSVRCPTCGYVGGHEHWCPDR